MTRGLYAWLFTRLDGCLPFRSLLDTHAGLRRMDRAELATYQTMLAFGHMVRGPAPGYEHRPIEFQTVAFSIWVRPEVPDPGDLVLEDIQDRMMRALVWRSPNDVIPGQDCTGEDPGIVVMDVEHLDGDTESVFDDQMQAWTRTGNLRFLVALATCAPRLAWCGPCGDAQILGGSSSSGQPAIGTRTAFTFVDNGDEGAVDEYDAYVCHPTINDVLLEATAHAGSIKLAYVNAPLMPDRSSAFYLGQLAAGIAAAGENAFWHDGFPATPANRIRFDAFNWYVRPSAALGTALANYFLGDLNPYFDGIFSDESTAGIQDHYWTAFKTVDPLDNGGIALTDADRPYWEGQWDEFMSAFLDTMKAGFGSDRAVIANSAGDVWPGIDGITKEESHILVDGEAVTLAQFEAQKLEWEASPNRFGDRVLNIAWNYDLPNEADLVYRGIQIT